MAPSSHLGHAIGDLRDFKLRRNFFADALELALLFESLDPIAQIVVSQSLPLQSSNAPHHTKAWTLMCLCLSERSWVILAAERPDSEEKKTPWLIPKSRTQDKKQALL